MVNRFPLLVTGEKKGVPAVDPRDVLTKKALMGALALYFDFINLFVMLLQLVGQRRE